jgi:hypothetical protein
MVASVEAWFAPQRGLRCCTKPQAVFGFCSFLSRFTCKSAQKGSGPEGYSDAFVGGEVGGGVG